MKFMTTLAALSITALSSVQAQTTTSFDSAALASASTRALESDGSFIMTVLLDLNTRYTTAVEFMNDNGMEFPAEVANYVAGIPDVSDTDQLMSVIVSNSFPFNDFYTMMTAFPWYSTLMAEAGATSFYLPEDFLTGDISASSAASSSAPSAEASSTASSSASISSFAAVVNATESSGISSIASSIANTTTSSASSSSSSAGASSLYVPMMALPVLLGAMLF